MVQYRLGVVGGNFVEPTTTRYKASVGARGPETEAADALDFGAQAAAFNTGLESVSNGFGI